MKLKLLIAFVFAGFSLMGQMIKAPLNYHRSYPMQRDSFNQHLGSVVYDGTTVVFSGLSKKDTLYSIIATAFEPKGDVLWSNELIIDDGKKLKINKFSFSTAFIPKDSILFSFTFDDNNNKNKVFGKLSINGRFGTLHQVSADSHPNGNTQANTKIATFRNNFFYHLSNLGSDSLIYLNLLNRDGSVLRTNRIRASGQSLIAADLAMNKRRNQIAILGSNTSFNSYFIGIVDTLGRVVTGHSFRDTVLSGRQIIPKRIINTSDNGFVVIGRYYQLNTSNISDSFFGSFISKHDSLSRLVWTKYINVSGLFPVVLDDVAESTNNAIVVAGTYNDSLTNNVVPFSIGFSQVGAPFYASKFERVEGLREYPGSLVAHEDGGCSYLSSITKTKKKEEPILSMVRINPNGGAMCEQPITQAIAFNLPLRRDTLIYTSSTSTDVKTEKINTRGKSNTFDVPTLTLESKTFCPNQPINLTLRATTKGAVKYEWSTGAKSDTIVVNKEGDYSVIVTINTNECYTLCDTSKISVYEKPQVQLLQEDGNFCTNGLMRVRSNVISTTPISSVVWSTGQRDTDRIDIASGNVSITVTDICNQQVSASINVVPLKLINNVNITSDYGTFCSSKTGRLTAVADAPVSGYDWGNNRFSQSIEIRNPGTYSVTVLDVCKNRKTASVTVTDANIPKVVDRVEILKDITDVCKDNTVGLRAVVTGQAKSIRWSNGSTTESIKVPNKFGTITVTANDDCGNKTNTTTVEDIDPICIKLPKLFFPESNNTTDSTANRVFRAIPVGCPTSGITDFEFKVFNRWGKEVFSTTNISGSWDGNFNGDKAAPDVYVYYIRYRQNSCSLNKKGDVTLIR